MKRSIGGYFSLELGCQNSLLHSKGHYLNSGRNALEHVLLSIPKITKLWIPYFTCDVILEPINKLNIPFSFYSINEQLEIKYPIKLLPDEYLLVTNYFGIKDGYIQKMAEEYGHQLIVDNAQAFFCESIEGIKTIYSPRKFVGIPDGGIAFANSGLDIDYYDKDVSYDRCSHLLKRCDLDAEEGYADFKMNSHKLANQPIRRMSKLTHALLESIDFESIRRKRVNNFSILDQALSKSNLLDIALFGAFNCPMVYPYYTNNRNLKKKLIDNGIFVATYWPNVFDWCTSVDTEYDFASNLLALPIDQRYGINEMEYIVKRMVE